jgi:hypothetical protein
MKHVGPEKHAGSKARQARRKAGPNRNQGGQSDLATQAATLPFDRRYNSPSKHLENVNCAKLSNVHPPTCRDRLRDPANLDCCGKVTP